MSQLRRVAAVTDSVEVFYPQTWAVIDEPQRPTLLWIGELYEDRPRYHIFGRWFPCEHPEKPADNNRHWHLVGCQGCRIAAEAERRREPDSWKARYIGEMLEPPL